MTPNPLNAPEVDPSVLVNALAAGEEPLLLDVREEGELAMASLPEGCFVAVPMSRLAQQGTAALPATLSQDRTAPLAVICHTGVRSAQVVMWLRQEGWEGAVSVAGGIAAWATLDPSVGQY